MIRERFHSQNPTTDVIRISKAYSNWKKVRILVSIEGILTNLRDFAAEREENRYTLHNYTEVKSSHFCKIPQNNVTKAIFDLCISIAYFISAFTATYYVFFINSSTNQLPTVHSLVTESLIAVDFLLKLIPFLISEGYERFSSFNQEKIYFSLSLSFEFLALFPFYLLSADLVWFRLFRILTINRLINWIEESYITKRILSEVLVKDEYIRKSLLGLFRFVTLVTITCHVIACIWYYIAVIEDDPNNWMQGKYTTESQMFMAALYWTTVTFTSVGYGDIVPKTIPEYIYTMIIEFLGIMFFAYLMGNVNTYIANIDKKQNAMIKRENELDKWIFELDRNYPEKVMPENIHKGIREFYKFQWENDDTSIENFNEFMLKLPTTLRHEMNIYVYKSKIEYLGAFMVGVPEITIYEIAASMKPKHERTAVEIVKQNSKSKFLYIIKTGNILLVDREPFLRLSPKSYFAESCIIFNEKSDFRFITDGECVLFTIHHLAIQKIAKCDFKVLALRAFRRNKYFHVVNNQFNKDQGDEESEAFIEEFNIFNEEVKEDEIQEFEIKLSKSLAVSTEQDDKYIRKIKEIQDLQFGKLMKLQEEVEALKGKIKDLEGR